MPEIPEEARGLVEEFQSYQQQLQNVMMQKETLKLQSAEITKALEELDASKENKAYKIAGNVMISKPIEDIKKDLDEMKETIGVRLKSFDKMEEKVNSKLKELQAKLKEVIK